MSQEPGWYYANGDPADTFRYWDGHSWVGQAKTIDTIDLTQTPTGAGQVANVATFGDAWARLVARFFDFLFLSIAAVIVVFIAAPLRGVSSTAFAIVMSAGVLAYEVAFVALAGATPGKMMFDLKVINHNNVAPPGWGPAVMRALPLLVGAIPFLEGISGLVLALACGILIWVTADRRSVFDFAGRTHVVKTMTVTQTPEMSLGVGNPPA